MKQTFVDREQPPERAGVVIPWTQYGARPSDARLEETRGLVEALGCELAFLRADNVRNPTAGYLLSGGLLDRLQEDVAANKCTMAVHMIPPPRRARSVHPSSNEMPLQAIYLPRAHPCAGGTSQGLNILRVWG